MRPRRPGPTLVATFLLLVLALGLTACADDPVAPGPVTPSDSPADSATPSAAVTHDPLADETPEQFLRRWVEVHNEMEVTGETEAFLALADNCGYCISFADRIEQIYAAGGWVKTKGWTVTSTRTVHRLPRGQVSVDFFVDSAATTYVERLGGAVKNLRGSKHLKYRLQLKPEETTWLVSLLTQVAQ